MGAPLIPWQRLAVDVGTELDDWGRRYRYHTVLISVPRQSGKTKSAMAVGMERTLTVPGSFTWFTAQTGQAARERWIKELATPAEQAMGGLVSVKRGAGDTRLVIPATGAENRPMPPTADYLHGSQSDLVMIDEAWAHTEPEGAALLQAIVPTMATRGGVGLGPQKWILSTKGTAASTWWHNMLDEAINEPRSGIAVVDYGIGPDVDPTDVAAVIAAHPGVGGGLIAPTAVYEAADSMTPAEFARGYGNVATSHAATVFDGDALDAATTMDPLDDMGAVHIGVAVSWDQATTAIVAASPLGGVPAVEVIDARPGQAWAVEAVAALARAVHPETIWIDPHGPSAGLAERLDAAHIWPTVRRADTDDMLQATEFVLSALGPSTDAALWLRADPDLRAELGGVALRTVGEKGRLFSRKHSVGSIARVEAATLALRGLTMTTTTTPAPLIWSPEP